MDKPLREITVGEWKALCDKRTKELREEGRGAGECDGCPMSSVCAQTPDEWDLPEETFAIDTNVGHKPAKPRLAEVLGVEVGERFSISGHAKNEPVFVVDADGFLHWDTYCVNSSESLYTAINHPESIIRTPRLTETEIAIMRAVGAKWVSRGALGTKTVVLWDAKPECFDDGTFGSTDTAHKLARMYTGFDSVHPGDCICVEEAGGDA